MRPAWTLTNERSDRKLVWGSFYGTEGGEPDTVPNDSFRRSRSPAIAQ
jgi:hypothetical protein